MQLAQDVLDRLTDRDAAAVVDILAVHHTADNDMDQPIEAIAREEIAVQGFTTVGYHAVIHRDGTVQYGRPLNKVPAANTSINAPNPAYRSANTRAYAIALEGNFQPDDRNYAGEKPTEAQIHALIALIENVKTKCPRLTYLLPHRDIATAFGDPADATACPGDLLVARLHEVRAATGLHAL